jgi:hypothetical protein
MIGLLFAAVELVTRNLSSAVPGGFVGLFWLSFPFVLQPLYYKRDFRRHPRFVEEILFEAKDEGLRVEASTGHGEVNWAAFTKFQETPNLFMLYMGARMFRIIPKRALAPHEVDAFRNLLTRHLPRK